MRSDIPPELLEPLSHLTHARATAVLNARLAWLEAGLTQRLASSHAVRYARKLSAKKQAMVKREAQAVSRAATRSERPYREAFNGGVERAQNAVSLKALENGLLLGELPWHVLEPVIQELA